MTTYFKKLTSLKLPLPTTDIDSLKGDLMIHYGYNRYHKLADNSFQNTIIRAMPIPPKQIWFAEALGPLNCHRDNGVKTVLNYYLRPSGYITEFWQASENTRRIAAKRYNSATDTYTDVLLGYVKEDCIFQDSFFAEAGDMYIMNSAEVHSVSKTDSSLEESRAFIQIHWDQGIDELIGAFAQL